MSRRPFGQKRCCNVPTGLSLENINAFVKFGIEKYHFLRTDLFNYNYQRFSSFSEARTNYLAAPLYNSQNLCSGKSQLLLNGPSRKNVQGLVKASVRESTVIFWISARFGKILQNFGFKFFFTKSLENFRW